MRLVTTIKRPRWTATAAGLALIGTMAACSPNTTDMTYAPSDGVRADIGSLAAINLLVVADDEGNRGSFIGAFSNPTTTPADLVVELPQGTVIVDETIDDNGLLNYNAQNPIAIEGLGAQPGTNIEAVLRSGDDEVTVNVPVLPSAEVDGVDTYHELAPTN